MPARQHYSRIDTLELKTRIERSLGRQKAEEYFDLLKRFLSLKISKSNFDKLCINKIGRENVCLHNHLIRSIISNACQSKVPPSKDHKVDSSLSVKVANGYQGSGIQSLCRDIPQSPQKGRTPSIRDRKFRDHLSSLEPYGKNHSVACEESLIPKFQGKQSTIEMLSFGSRPPGSVEDGEEVDQAAGSPSVYSRSPVRAPLGIPLKKGMRKMLCSGSMTAIFTGTCQNGGELPDTSSLRKRLEQKWETEGVKISVDCANLLNNGLDVYLERLIKPCLDLAGSRSVHKHIDQRHSCAVPGLMGMLPERYVQKKSEPIFAIMSDFRVTMELNPLILGADWPTELEKVCLCALED